jgi:heme-degrading monooxygenase HmoA
MAARMLALAQQQPGFLGMESARQGYAGFRVRIAKVEREYGV